MPSRAPGGGRKRKPTALRMLEGNVGRVKYPENEPFPPALAAGYPAPEWLGPVGRKVWHSVAHELAACGLLTVIDVPKLARYCDAWERWKIARDYINEHGTHYDQIQVVQVPNPEKPGEMLQRKLVVGAKIHPQLRVYHQMHAMLQQLESEFGMSPTARTRIQVIISNPNGAEPPKNPFDYDVS